MATISNFQIAIWRRQIEQVRAGYERAFEDRFYTVLLRQANKLYDDLDRRGVPIEFVLDDRDIRGVYLDYYEQVGIAFADMQYNALTGKSLVGYYETKDDGPTPDWLSVIRARALASILERVAQVTAYSKKKLKEIVMAAFTAGLTPAQIAKRLRQEWAALSRSRAKSIVETEVLTASNLGLGLGAEAAEVGLRKAWITMRDKRVRPTHSVLHNTQVGQNEMFLVAGLYEAEYPGDFRLPVHEIARCRCTVLYQR
jgi:hypothetical protein